MKQKTKIKLRSANQLVGAGVLPKATACSRGNG